MRPVRRSVLAAAGTLSILAGLLPAIAAPALAVSPDLFVSEYVEGSSNNKALEIYNGTGADVNLASAGYSVQMFFNGSTTAGLTISLAGTLSNNDVHVVAHSSASAGILAQANQTNGSGWFNGDDAVVLSKGTTVIDSIGQVGVDPGMEWGTGLASTADNTLRRKGSVTAGDSNAADAFDPAAGWDGFATDTFGGLGAHGDAAPTVTATIPTAGAAGVPESTNLTVTFSEPVGATGTWFAIDCLVTGLHAATVTGGPTEFTLDPNADFASSEDCTLTIHAAAIGDVDGNDPPDTMTADVAVPFSTTDACEATYTPIPAIQGEDDVTDVTGSVSTKGVVVADHEGPAPELRGFYIQDATGDSNPLTSDGIFVFNGSNNSVAPGDLVRVSGTASEFQGQTQITASSITDCGDATVAPTAVSLPFASATYLERYEGMLVRLPQTLVVNEHFQLGRFGQLTVGSERHFSPTLVAEPGPAAVAEAAAQRLDSLLIDDDLQNQNADPIVFGREGDPLTAANTLRTGDTVTDATGVMTFTWAGNNASGNAYRLRPISSLGGGMPAFQPSNPRPVNPDPIDGDLRVAAMNVLNYFTTIDAGPDVCGPNGGLDCRGADSQTEFDRQQAKIVAAITGLDADIVGLNELENNASASLESIVAALDDVDGPGTWASVQTGTIGTDAIKIGIIYKPAAVTPVGPHAILTSAVDPRFDDSRSRPALAQTFDQIGGGRLTVVVNHLKSKGSACGAGDPDTGDGAGNCNGTRTRAAEALVDWIASDPTGSGDRDTLVIGDLNSYAKEDPIDVFIREGYTNLVEQFFGDHAYSYVFDASSGYLDHALASPTLAAQVKGVTEWHINADEPGILDYNTEFKSVGQIESLYAANEYRSADHDPVLVGLDLLDYRFSGFQAPVDNEPILNAVKAGVSVPVKWELAGDLGLDVLFGLPTATQFTCSSGAQSDTVETTTAGASGLQYDAATNTYTYVWKTARSWAGQCRELEVTLDDGTYRRADFSFTR